MGNTAMVYQALINGQIGIYPEETGTIQATVLKEVPFDRCVDGTLERVRNEMRRIAQAEVLRTFRNRQFLGHRGVRKTDAAKTGWKR